jgi:hypothetical protein
MGRTAKPRKRYRPGRIERDPVEAAAAFAALLPPATRDFQTANLRGAFNRMRQGLGDMATWSALADYMNVAQVLAELSICSDREPEINDAHEALSHIHQRHAERARMVLTGPEIATLELAVDVAAIQLRYCSQGELQRAIDTARRRLLQARAGNAPRNAVVCVSTPPAPTNEAPARAPGAPQPPL